MSESNLYLRGDKWSVRFRVGVNIAINEWGEEIFRDIALGFLSSTDTRVTVDGHSADIVKLSA